MRALVMILLLLMVGCTQRVAPQEQPEVTTENKTQVDLRELLESNLSYECTVMKNGEIIKYWIKEGRFRSEQESKFMGLDMDIIVIGSKDGVYMNTPEGEECDWIFVEADQNRTAAQEEWSPRYNQQTDVKCHPANISDELFKVEGNVCTLKEWIKEMQSLQGPYGGG